MVTPYRAAVVGCGLIGTRRAEEIAKDPRSQLVCVIDSDFRIAENLAHQYGCFASSEWQKEVISKNIDVLVIATPNILSAEIAIHALKNQKHVLVEKPLGRSATESGVILKVASESPTGLTLKTGFNHRFHPAIFRAKKMVEEGAIGEIITIRARYGHGGRPGMEKEWRASKELCGGGELLDQGVHLIDLIRWFGGDIAEIYGRVETLHWKIEVEDNAFVILKTKAGVTAQFHVSWTNWKNIFSFEIFGTLGYLSIQGLGRSYGLETLEWGKRRLEGGVPEVFRYDFPDKDISWQSEWDEFLSAIDEKRRPLGSGLDGYEAHRVIEAIYESSRRGEIIRL